MPQPRDDDRAFDEPLAQLDRPIQLGAAYLRRLARLEALAVNRGGADRSRVERVAASDRRLYQRAERVA